MKDGSIERFVLRAQDRLDSRLAQWTPFCRERLHAWLPVAFSPDLERFWLSPSGFPVLQLPFWLAESHGITLDDQLAESITASSMALYLYVRMVDRASDGDGDGGEAALLPAASILHAEFQSAFDGFSLTHPFRADLMRFIGESCDATLIDRLLDDVTAEDFARASSRKYTCAKIPLSAVAHRFDRVESLPQWLELIDRLGTWCQLNNDFFDWSRDQRHGVRTYVLSEAKRRCRAGEALAAWFGREGIAWWSARLDDELQRLTEWAATLDSQPLNEYLARRASSLRARLENARMAASVLDAVAIALAGPPPVGKKPSPTGVDDGLKTGKGKEERSRKKKERRV